MTEWHLRKVQRGLEKNRTIGFPTLNFHAGDFGKIHSAGVYACEVEILGQSYRGALYFGPRLGTGEMVLEMYVMDFDQMVYDEYAKFRVLGKIRNALPFNNLNEIKDQIEKDLKAATAR